MTACLISSGLSQLSYDHNYEKPITHCLYGYICRLINTNSIDGSYTMGEPGPDTLWAWALVAEGVKYIHIAPCQNFELGMTVDDKERYENIRKVAKYEITIATAGFSEPKRRAAIDYMISRSDLIIFVWNGKGGVTSEDFIKDTIEKAKRADKEIILVNPNELL